MPAKKPTIPPASARVAAVAYLPVTTGSLVHAPIKPPNAVLMPDLERLRAAGAKGVVRGKDEHFDLRMRALQEWQATPQGAHLVRTRGGPPRWFLAELARQWLEAYYSQTGQRHLLPKKAKTKGRVPASETLVQSSYITRYQLNRLASKFQWTQQECLAHIVEEIYRKTFPEG